MGRIDYIVDSGPSPTVVYGPIVASGTTSLNPVIVDSVGQYVYASFNTNGTNAIVVQAPTSLASSVSVAVGTGNTTYTGRMMCSLTMPGIPGWEPHFCTSWERGAERLPLFTAWVLMEAG